MIFKLCRLALIVAVVLTGIAMTLYPGGTFVHRADHGYSFFQNSLSDLGNTVAWNGEPNPGALFQATAAVILVTAGGTCLLALVRVYSSSPLRRRLARAGGVAVVVAGAALMGATLSPQDRQPALHGQFSLLAIASFPMGTALLAAATALDGRFRPRVPIGWLVLTLIAVAWAAAMSLIRPTTDVELMVPVTLQKVVAIALIATLVLESYEAERAGAPDAMATRAG